MNLSVPTKKKTLYINLKLFKTNEDEKFFDSCCLISNYYSCSSDEKCQTWSIIVIHNCIMQQ